MNNMKESSDIEPRVNGRLLSHVMTRESEDAARAEYRDKALGMFDTGWLSGTHLDSIIKDLENAEKKFRKEDFVTLPFEDNDLEGIQAVLSLPAVIFFGQFVWRGKNGNYRSDPRFDDEETYDETDETRLRSKFIKALGAYSRGAATWAKELGCDEAKKLFLNVLATLTRECVPDPERGLTRKDAGKVLSDFIEASKLLWGEWQTELVRQGKILSKTEEARLLDEIQKSMERIVNCADKAIKRCNCVNDNKKRVKNIAYEAICSISDEVEDYFMPAIMRYSIIEEADFPYDETLIGFKVLPLCELLFGKDSLYYRHCTEYMEELNEQLTFPVSRFSSQIWPTNNPSEKGETKYLPEAWMNLCTEIVEATKDRDEISRYKENNSQLDRIESGINAIATAVKAHGGRPTKSAAPAYLQKQIAKMLGVSEDTIRRWEHGKTTPPADTLKTCARGATLKR